MNILRKMKKTHQRQIRNYNTYEQNEKAYFGLLPYKGRFRVDVKRLEKSRLVDISIINLIKSQNRSTKYFHPEKQERSDYYCNFIRDKMSEMRREWHQEFLPAIKKISTPEEVGRQVRDYYINSGIADFDEWDEIEILTSTKRMKKYNEIIYAFSGQFIHYLASNVEQIIVNVLCKLGYPKESFNLSLFNEFIKNNYDVSLKEVNGYMDYIAFRNLWNFLKHNTLSSYKKLRKSSPNLLVDRTYQNGDFALWYVKISESYIDETITKLMSFFDSFCKQVLLENIEFANWNYDKYFLKIFHDHINDAKNPF